MKPFEEIVKLVNHNLLRGQLHLEDSVCEVGNRWLLNMAVVGEVPVGRIRDDLVEIGMGEITSFADVLVKWVFVWVVFEIWIWDVESSFTEFQLCSGGGDGLPQVGMFSKYHCHIQDEKEGREEDYSDDEGNYACFLLVEWLRRGRVSHCVVLGICLIKR